MQLVLSILLLPLYSPADVAETVATLDVISEGRVVLGVGLGYRDIEYQAFNVERRHRVGRFMESLELVQRLWTEDEVTFHGKHFKSGQRDVRDSACAEATPTHLGGGQF